MNRLSLGAVKTQVRNKNISALKLAVTAIALALMLMTFAEPVVAQNSMSLASATGDRGDVVTIELAITNGVVVKGWQTDILFDDSVASFSDAVLTPRSSGINISAEDISPGRMRIIMYYDDASTMNIGTGAVAELSFSLIGNWDSLTSLTLTNWVLSDVEANTITVVPQDGSLSINAASGPPVLTITTQKNPAQPRYLHILVLVDVGSDSAPTMTVANEAVTLSLLKDNIYHAYYAAPNSANSLLIEASDTNSAGTGTDQQTAQF